MLSDTFHPWQLVTNAAGRSRAAGSARRLVSRWLYDYLARNYPQTEWTTMNYGYALLPGEPAHLAVDPHVPEHLALQLYGRVVSAAAATAGDPDEGTLAGCDVLEIGSGRGGGAAHVARRFRPQRVVALDVSAAATALAHELHGGGDRATKGVVEFRQGDAENLPFAEASFDFVLNVESAHCYGSVPQFLGEVHRVLRPGGKFSFADFVSRRGGALDRLRACLAGGPLQLVRTDDITANVLAALAQDEARKRALLARWVKRPLLRSFAQGAYAMEGSAMRRELLSGQTVYLAALLVKAEPAGG